MKRFLYLSLLLLGIVSSIQSVQAQFFRYYPDLTRPRSIQTADGGFTLMASRNPDVRLVRLDQVGDVVWDRRLWKNNISGGDFGGKFLLETQDGGYVASWTNDDDRYFWRMDPWGDTLWSANLDTISGLLNLMGAMETQDGGFLSVGSVTTDPANQHFESCLVKIDSLGSINWMQVYDLDTVPEVARGSIVETADHGYAFTASTYDMAGYYRSYLLRTDSVGQLLWHETYGDTTRLEAYGVTRLSDGNFILYGQYSTDDFSVMPEGWAMWVDSLGQEIKQQTYTHVGTTTITHALEGANGGITFLGRSFDFSTGSQSVTRMWESDTSGVVPWTQHYDWPQVSYYFGRTQSGGYCLMGEQSSSRWASFSLTDSLGIVNTNLLEGQFFIDLNANCLLDAGESAYTPLPLGVEVRDLQTNQTYYSKVDSTGGFQFDLPLGTYEIVPSAHPYLSYPCTNPDTVVFQTPYQVIQYDVAVQIEDSCTYNQVSIGSPFLRIGDTCRIDVEAWNFGTVISTNTTVEVELDSFISYISSDSPLVAQMGQVLTFDLDTLAVGESKRIRIFAFLDSTVVPGQTHCLEAHIFPDTVCGTGNLWTGANIQAGIKCLGDSIKFSVKNLGNSMLQHRNYLIYIDDVIFRMDSFQLNNGDSLEITDPTTAGATYRIEAQQEAGYPITLGDPIAIAFKEGCLALPGGGFNTGWINSFYNGNAAPAQAITCLENQTSYDPNDKRAQPFGYDSLHYIRANTPLMYQIRFQNTGTDTAQRVIIVDTLSQHLDPSTLLPGAASHPYRWDIRDQNIVRFIFQPIQLVDSLTNPEASQGYVMFTIRQRPDNPIGTLIENRAGIYFDFNPPIITNTAFHLIGEDFIRIELLEPTFIFPLEDNLRVVIAPNPVGNRARVMIEGGSHQSYSIELYTLTGQKVYTQTRSAHSELWLEPSGLVKGMYSYMVKGDGQLLQTGLIRLE